MEENKFDSEDFSLGCLLMFFIAGLIGIVIVRCGH